MTLDDKLELTEYDKFYLREFYKHSLFYCLNKRNQKGIDYFLARLKDYRSDAK